MHFEKGFWIWRILPFWPILKWWIPIRVWDVLPSSSLFWRALLFIWLTVRKASLDVVCYQRLNGSQKQMANQFIRFAKLNRQAMPDGNGWRECDELNSVFCSLVTIESPAPVFFSDICESNDPSRTVTICMHVCVLFSFFLSLFSFLFISFVFWCISWFWEVVRTLRKNVPIQLQQ